MEQNQALFPHLPDACKNQGMPGGSKSVPGPLTQELAIVIAERMVRLGVKDQAVSDAVGLSRAQIQKIRTGKKQIDIEDFDRICSALGLTFLDEIQKADAATSDRRAEPGWDVTPL